MKLNQNSISSGATLEVKQPFAKLLFSFVFPSTTTTTNAIASLSGVKLSYEKYKDGKPQKRIDSRPFDLLSLISTQVEGNIDVTTVGNTHVLNFTLPIGNGGEAKFTADRYASFVIESIPDGVTLDVYSMPSNNYAVSEFAYNHTKVVGDTPTTLPIASASFLAIPKPALRKLTLTTSNGKLFELLPAELDRICSEQSEVTYNINGTIKQGTGNYYILKVDDVNSVKLDLNQDAVVTTLNHLAAD